MKSSTRIKDAGAAHASLCPGQTATERPYLGWVRHHRLSSRDTPHRPPRVLASRKSGASRARRNAHTRPRPIPTFGTTPPPCVTKLSIATPSGVLRGPICVNEPFQLKRRFQ